MTLLLLLFIFFLYYYLCRYGKNNSRSVFIIIMTLVLILISGLRHEAVGNDTFGTMLKYERIVDTSWDEVLANFWERYFNPSYNFIKDPGEDIFYKLLSYITKDPRIFLIITGIIVLCSLGSFIYNSAKTFRGVLFSYVIFVSLFYAYIPNSSFRQAMAFAILLQGYQALNKKKYLLFLGLLVFASFFHKSILISIILLPLLFLKETKLVYWGSFFLFVYVFFNYRNVGALLSETSDIYEYYLYIDFYKYNNQPFMVIIMALGLYIYNGIGLYTNKRCSNNRLYIYGSALTLVFTPLIRLDPSALRLISYFGILLAIQVANSSYGSAFMRHLFWVIVFIFFFKASLNPDDGYRFMWQEKQLHYRYGMIQGPLNENHEKETFFNRHNIFNIS